MQLKFDRSINKTLYDISKISLWLKFNEIPFLPVAELEFLKINKICFYLHFQEPLSFGSERYRREVRWDKLWLSETYRVQETGQPLYCECHGVLRMRECNVTREWETLIDGHINRQIKWPPAQMQLQPLSGQNLFINYENQKAFSCGLIPVRLGLVRIRKCWDWVWFG